MKAKHVLLLSALVCLLLIIWGGILAPDAEMAAQAAQASTPTPEAARPGYTNYSGYYRMRCWPACHTKDIPESVKRRAAQATNRPTPEAKPGYTNYSGYYRMRCWPACHTKDIPECIQPEPRGYTNYSGYYRMRCWPACHTKDIPESMQKTG